MTQNFATDVLIVGAGLSGLMAAHTLQDAGKTVLLLDKGTSVGGRLATRRIGTGLADHGAQFFTVRDPVFGAFVERWLADGLVFEWSRGWADGSLATTRDGHPRYAVKGGMNQLAKHLAEGLDIRVNAKVTAVRQYLNGWQAELEDGTLFSARSLLLTAPVPQSLALLEAGAVLLTADDEAALQAIHYEPCLTAIALLDRPLNLPVPGGIQREGANIHWVADNQRKGISGNSAVVTMQAAGMYSRNLWDQPDETILNVFRTDLLPLLGQAQIVELQLKKWRYSRPISVHPEHFLASNDGRMVFFAGDAFGAPRVEGAALSGLAVGAVLIERLKSS